VPGILKIHHREVSAEITVRRPGDPVTAVQVCTAAAVAVDRFESNHATGLFLVIDPESEAVIGVGKVSRTGRPEFSYAI
jgi:sulfate adenylyltransferase subunit 1 (EFTu-like GTPase family)